MEEGRLQDRTPLLRRFRALAVLLLLLCLPPRSSDAAALSTVAFDTAARANDVASFGCCNLWRGKPENTEKTGVAVVVAR